MTRFFYTDPLAAAWMAKHFGMNFEGCQHGGYVNVPVHANADPDVFPPDENEYYILPDSLHLLEPQQNDLALAEGAANPTVAFFRGVKWWALHGGEKSNRWRIIQRNGISFMWPEQEP